MYTKVTRREVAKQFLFATELLLEWIEQKVVQMRKQSVTTSKSILLFNAFSAHLMLQEFSVLAKQEHII